MRIDEIFTVAAPPEAVFDYMTDPANLAAWQTSKTHVEPLTDGPPRLGYQIRERTKPPGGKEFEQGRRVRGIRPPRAASRSTSSRARTPSTAPGPSSAKATGRA